MSYTHVYSERHFAEIEDAVDDLFVDVLEDHRFSHTDDPAVAIIGRWVQPAGTRGMICVEHIEVSVNNDGSWVRLAEVSA